MIGSASSSWVEGSSKKDRGQRFIKENRRTAATALSLPYQPIESLRYSLSAADVHLVTLGDEMVGIIHPCKVYGSHGGGAADPVRRSAGRATSATCSIAHDFGRHARHGDVDATVGGPARNWLIYRKKSVTPRVPPPAGCWMRL